MNYKQQKNKFFHFLYEKSKSITIFAIQNKHKS